jgi:3-oxoacyl-[acyl-carrier protein] reductase
VDLHLSDKRALIVCATGGIGRACASALAHECAEVTIVARNPAGIEETCAAIADESGAKAHGIAADVTTQAGVLTVLNGLNSPPDIVVLLPPRHGPLPDAPSADDVEGQFSTEVRRPLDLVEQLLPHMRAQGWGRIVHLTGAAVKRPAGKLLALTSLRVALIAYLRGMAQREAEHGITVNGVLIGYIDTPGLRKNWEGQAAAAGLTYDELLLRKLSESSIHRLGKPAEIATLVTHLAGEQAGYITGEVISCDGGRGGHV